jgi:hypothetical protein
MPNYYSESLHLGGCTQITTSTPTPADDSPVGSSTTLLLLRHAPVGSSAGCMVARKARQSRRSESMQGSGSQLKPACGVCGCSPENRRVTWFSHKTKTRGSAGRDGIRACREVSMPADAWRDRRACIGRTRSTATAWSCDEEECYMTYLPLRGCITT